MNNRVHFWLAVLGVFSLMIFVFVAVVMSRRRSNNEFFNQSTTYHNIILSTNVHGGMDLVQDWPENFYDNLEKKHDHRFWTAQQSIGEVVLVNCAGKIISPSVRVPPGVGGSSLLGSPNGLAVNVCATGFQMTDGSNVEPAHLLIVTEDGTIAGYNSSLDANNALTLLDASQSGKVFKGCCLCHEQLFVTNFSDRVVEVYDNAFGPVTSFTDSELVTNGFSPFNVECIDGKLYVTFVPATLAADTGSIVVFSSDGTRLQRLVDNSTVLNLPYGMIAQCNRLVVSNGGGDGCVNLFNLSSGKWISSLHIPKGEKAMGMYGLVMRRGRRHKTQSKCSNIMFYLSTENFGELRSSCSLSSD